MDDDSPVCANKKRDDEGVRMEYVRFGNTGLHVSRFGLGTMLFSKKLDFEQSALVLAEALDAGVNLIDTAESYRESETFLGRMLGERRDEIFLATKVHRMRAQKGRAGRNSRCNMVHCLERSLTRLQTDHIDLYQLHHPDAQTPLEETLSSLDQLVRQGKVRYIGVSNHFAWQMAWMLGEARLHRWEPLVSNQCAYSLLDRSAEPEIVPFCQRFNIAMLIYSPLCGGVLTGKYLRDHSPPPGSRGEKDWVVGGHIGQSATFDALDEIQALASELSLNMAQLALLWLKSKPHATCLLLGGSQPEHYRPLYEVADQNLPDELTNKLDNLTDTWRYRSPINRVDESGPPMALNW